METLLYILGAFILYLLYKNYKKRSSPEYKQNKENSKLWDRMWNDHSTKSSFFNFRMERFGHGSYLSDIKKKYQNDMSLWTDYNKFLKESHKKEHNKNKVNSDLSVLKQRIVHDFNSNSYSDKISTTTGYYEEVKVTYVFENGDTVSLCGKELIYTTKSNAVTYTLGLFTRNEYVNLFNSIIAELNKYSNRNLIKRPTNKPSIDHPKRKLYNTIQDTIRRREDQLRKGDYEEGDKLALENDLNNSRRKLKKIKDKYNF